MMKPALCIAIAASLVSCKEDPADPPGKTDTADDLATDSGCEEEVFYADADGDGYGDPGQELSACELPEGAVETATDCDDGDASVNPDAEEVCNGLDDDCSGAVDDGVGAQWYADADGDGYGDDGTVQQACDQEAGWVDVPGDCDDAQSSVSPDGTEVCDGVDNDCDGQTDEDVTTPWYADNDFDGHGDPAAVTEACEQPDGTVASAGDCDDTTAAVYPGALDVCNARDDDCDGTTDEDVKVGWSLVSIDTSAGFVYEIDPATAATVSISPIDASISGVNSMDVWEDGTAIAHSNAGSVLYSFDVCQGMGMELGATGVSGMGGISFGGGNQLYGLNSGSNQLVLLDLGGAGSTVIGPLGTGIGNNGMAYDCSTDTLYGADASGDRIFTVDPATGLAGNFIATSVPFSSVGLEFDHSTGLLIAATGSELWTVDPATGTSTFIGDLGGQNIDDLAFYPQCP